MYEDEATDMLNKLVLDHSFIEEQIDRLLAWEIFVRRVRGRDQEEMLPLELCDRIGVSILYINHLLEDIKKRPQFYAK